MNVTVTGPVGVSATSSADQFTYDTTWGPLLTFSTWNQSGTIDGTTDWNQYCPMDTATGDRSLTGCTATAESQLLYYWHFPQSISFSASDDYTSVSDTDDRYSCGRCSG